MIEPYIDDVHYYETSDRDKAVATHLRGLARKLIKTANRFEPECNLYDSLRGSSLDIGEMEDSALEQVIINYIKANYKKIGDTSVAHGLPQIIRHGTQYYRL